MNNIFLVPKCKCMTQSAEHWAFSLIKGNETRCIAWQFMSSQSLKINMNIWYGKILQSFILYSNLLEEDTVPIATVLTI